MIYKDAPISMGNTQKDYGVYRNWSKGFHYHYELLKESFEIEMKNIESKKSEILSLDKIKSDVDKIST